MILNIYCNFVSEIKQVQLDMKTMKQDEIRNTENTFIINGKELLLSDKS